MDTKANQPGASIYLSSDRLASLSDTMFGVAMTLVATTLLPAIQAQKGSVLDMLIAINGTLFTTVLSFAVSARYWVSQQQRLAMARSVTPLQTWLHLVFLFLIVLIPLSTSLPDLAGSAANRESVIIYGAHLVLIALLNLFSGSRSTESPPLIFKSCDPRWRLCCWWWRWRWARYDQRLRSMSGVRSSPHLRWPGILHDVFTAHEVLRVPENPDAVLAA